MNEAGGWKSTSSSPPGRNFVISSKRVVVLSRRFRTVKKIFLETFWKVFIDQVSHTKIQCLSVYQLPGMV